MADTPPPPAPFHNSVRSGARKQRVPPVDLRGGTASIAARPHGSLAALHANELNGPNVVVAAIEGPPELERALQAADYAAIYPLIAGTFTPFCLTFLHGTTQGWAFFGALWLLAVSGSTLTLLAFDHLPKQGPRPCG